LHPPLGTLLVFAAAAVVAPTAARAELVSYRPAVAAGGAASVQIALPYTFGTHTFQVATLQGEVRADWKDTPVVSGRLVVPLTALRGGGDTLNCHMREAMGLDYAKSAFPGSHVCSGGQLPASGNDAVAFPEIVFEILRVTVTGARSRGADGDTFPVAVSGRWIIHGIARNDAFDLRLTVPADIPPNEGTHPRSIRVEGMRKIRLADYGVKVKRALVITAGEDATVKLDFWLKAQE
jgi:polyisoprenoid-binding protein YceI